MTLKELDQHYREKFKNKQITKFALREYMKTMKDYFPTRNIVDIFFDEMYIDEMFEVSIIPFVFFYKDREETIKHTMELLFLYYIGMTEEFTLDEIIEIRDTLDHYSFDSWNFIDLLQLNKKLPDDVKLWLKIR